MRGRSVSSELLRRIALAAQGLHRRRPWRAGRAGADDAVSHLGYVQIDTLAVVARAHEHVLSSRVPGFRPEHVDALLREGRIFEYWAHAAALLPMRDYRFALPRMRRQRARWRRLGERDRRAMARVRDRIHAEGPLRARDFETPEGHVGGWWSFKPAKRALERLFQQGDLAVVGRKGFEKRFDLAERALPSWVDTRRPTRAEHAEHLVETAARSLGVFTARECLHGRHEPGLAASVGRALERAVAERRLVPVRAPDGGDDSWYADAATLGAPPARVAREPRVLSPFDNLLIHRRRCRRLFGFDYQLECYRPPRRRRYGYFALPVLSGTRFVARADCKAHRGEGVFELRALHLEPGAAPAPDALARAFAGYARFTGCTRLRCRTVTGTSARASRALLTAFRDAAC